MGHQAPLLLELELGRDLSEIDRVNEVFATFAAEHHVSLAVIRQFKLVFDELLNNIITHAYEDQREHAIQVAVRYSSEQLTASITDDGAPFNPLRFGIPPVEASIDERRVGGLGIHLVRNVMDDVLYNRVDDHNVVTVVKNLSGESGSGDR